MSGPATDAQLDELIKQQKITNQLLFIPAIKAMGMSINITDHEGAEKMIMGWMEDIEWAGEL